MNANLCDAVQLHGVALPRSCFSDLELPLLIQQLFALREIQGRILCHLDGVALLRPCFLYHLRSVALLRSCFSDL